MNPVEYYERTRKPLALSAHVGIWGFLSLGEETIAKCVLPQIVR
jgi:hypothetical protein